MSVFLPRFHELSPFFRLADELDKNLGQTNRTTPGNSRSFALRFDVKETKDAYELHGELPGIEQSNVNLEWSDDNTLVISGHTEKSYESGSPRITDGNEQSKSHQPTVEEDAEESKNTSTQMAKTGKKDVAKSDQDQPRFWVSERSYGSFHRTFQFPANVDQDSVKANLKNGILEIIVPKAKAREPRKITINWNIASC